MSDRDGMTKRTSRFLSYPLAAGVLAAGMLTAATTAASAGTDSAAQARSSSGGTPTAAAVAFARNTLQKMLSGHHALDEHAGTAQKINGQTQVKSNNWSGYADTGKNFSKVSGSWTEPTASCGLNVESLAAFWVGIDGYNSSTVEQDGTMVECYLGTMYQYTWWETYPGNSVQTVGSTVHAGDHITASVNRSGSSYALRVTDSTHPANSFSTTRTVAGAANSSAEWIAEAPSGSLGVYPLTNFGTWHATGASVSNGTTTGSISSFPDYEITMDDTLGLTEAAPSALTNSGTAFSVAWKSSY